MKQKLYTLSHNIDLLKEIDNDGGQFTAEEHSYIMKAEFGKTVFKTREDLLHYWLSMDYSKLGALSYVIGEIYRKGFTNILSLGAGSCVLEYLLKLSLPKESKVIACDFDSFIIDKAKDFFPNIITEKFDFFSNDIKSLQSKLNIEFDLVVFFGSAYVMDNMEFIKLFGDLKKICVKLILDFHAFFIN